MAASSHKPAICPNCSAKNAPDAKRCASCGGAMEPLSRARTPELDRERRWKQEGFSIIWWLVAMGVQAVLTAALVIGLPMVVGALDFEGSNGMLMCVPVWFLGGMLCGMISPGKTFMEPVVASLLVAIPTVFYLVESQTVRVMPVFMYVVMAAVGVMFTLIGAYIGERIQMGPPPKTAE